MIPTLKIARDADRQRVERLLSDLRLDVGQLAGEGRFATEAAAVRRIVADVAERGDDALVDIAQQFDDPAFTADMLRVGPDEMAAAAGRVPADQLAAVRRSIAQVREYQEHLRPTPPPALHRPGVELGVRFTPVDSAGLYFPGGKASYPSSLIMLAVPAIAAGVPRVVVATPPSKFGRSDLVLAAAHELRLDHVYRVGGAAAVAAMAFGTATVPRVDKIVGPGNVYVQLAKREVAGAVGTDGFLGPSEILVIADDTGVPAYIAADLIAQAEHDPGSCFLLTTSPKLAEQVTSEIGWQLADRGRAAALVKSLRDHSAIVLDPDLGALIELANRFAAEHVNLQVVDPDAVLAQLRHAGCVFVGPHGPVAAGDYVAGPSHCLPTNTTARFASGVSVYEFLKRTSVVRYAPEGLAADAAAIVAMAEAEGLDGHAASVRVRGGGERPFGTAAAR